MYIYNNNNLNLAYYMYKYSVYKFSKNIFTYFYSRKKLKKEDEIEELKKLLSEQNKMISELYHRLIKVNENEYEFIKDDSELEFNNTNLDDNFDNNFNNTFNCSDESLELLRNLANDNTFT